MRPRARIVGEQCSLVESAYLPSHQGMLDKTQWKRLLTELLYSNAPRIILYRGLKMRYLKALSANHQDILIAKRHRSCIVIDQSKTFPPIMIEWAALKDAPGHRHNRLMLWGNLAPASLSHDIVSSLRSENRGRNGSFASQSPIVRTFIFTDGSRAPARI